MSTTDPTGEGGGGGGEGGGEGASTTTTTTNVEQTASPSTPITGTAVPAQPATQQQQQHPPPSPLSGCYLLVVLPEPHTAQHKDLILNRLAKGFLSWDKDNCHVDLEKELLALVAQAPEGEEARNGERLIQYATENLVTEVLIHPQTNTLLQCIRNFLASFTKHRHIIHAGYTFGGNGSWILQDGTFSLADFLDAFSEHEVQRVLRAYENSVTVDIHCVGVGDWTTSRLSKEACCRSCRVRVNPDDVLTAGMLAITSFTNYIGQYLVAQTLDQLMEPSDVVGNIRFSHPTLYVFPGGQGDAALFGINGFNMLVDGGFARKACFWDFTRHLDRLDAVLVTRINNSNIGGMFSVLRKKKEMHVYPQIGYFFCNLVERRQSNSPDGDKDIDPLILNLTDIGQEMVLNLRHISLRAHPCYRDPDPINLYHKVGHGTLDMYVLSPSKDSREVREFLVKWHASDSKLFAGSHKKDSNNLTFPIQNLVSICALLVWQPANPEDTITRILFPGSTPQHKIFEGFERLKHLDFLKHPVCSAKTLSPSTSLATLRDKPTKQKLSLIEKESKKVSELRKREPSEPKSIKAVEETPKITPQSTPIIPISKPKSEIKTKKIAENKKVETEAKETKKLEPDMKESKKIEKELKEVKKEAKKEPAKEKVEKVEKDDIKKTDLIKPEPEKTAPKEPKAKPEPKKKEPKEGRAMLRAAKGEAMPKPKPSGKRTKPSSAEKKDAVKISSTTPKKTLNGTATKTEISKAVPKVRPAPKVAPSLPAKSAKEANNRKVVEQKNIEKSGTKDTTAAPVVKVSAKPKPMDRKPISRRTKPVSPSKARMPGSPAKSTRSTPTTSVKSDKDGVIRKVKGDKGTTDSSTVSTPSGIEPEAVKPIDKSLIEQSEDISLDSIESKVLADLKEEREVVEEIEAVLQKAERIEETRKDDRFEGDDEITAEATDKKEEDITEEDVTAEIEDAPKKEGSRKESQELTEEDEYLIVEKEEVYTEDSVQSGEGEQKHVLDEAESEKAKILKDIEAMKEKDEKEEPEEKGKDESPEKKIEKEEKEVADLSTEHKEQLQAEVKEIIASATEIVQKVEEKDDSGKKDSEDITKEPSSLSPDKLDSSEKKITDTDIKPDVDQKEQILEKMEESQERISTIESGATTTAPTLPEDERIPLDEIKEDIDEKHVIEEVKEKDAPAKLREEVVLEAIPAPVKPEVKVFDVRQAIQNLQRDIVKTPDEVADLPVHEEVDPKLYRMEDFEKRKEEKPLPTPQEIKEPPTPPIKEQKGVFSFFGKVADKFEKGIDKLTKKTKKDTDKDSDEKSSSKSSSPKEVKVQEKTLLEEVDMEKMFPKVGKPTDKPETFEEVQPTIADVKMAAIKETAAFIQQEILDAKRKSVSDIEEKLPTDKPGEIITKVDIEAAPFTKVKSPVLSPTKSLEDQEIAKEIELLKEEGIEEDAEEVKALLEEASKKFKTVKDSLRDSLESLEEKIKEEEEMAAALHELQPALSDAVKDTLEGVIEKLEEIKPHIESQLPDTKEPEKVKFDIPKDEDFEEEYEEEPEGPFRDVKEAVRDVGEVLAGTAGIELEDKSKDVVEIVKKVAEVLKEDDFLSHKALFEEPAKKKEISPIPTDGKPSREEISPVPTDRKLSKEEISPISAEKKSSVPSEKESPEEVAELDKKVPKPDFESVVMPRKVGVTEEIPAHEEVEELIQEPEKPLATYETDAAKVKEEPCVKVTKKEEEIMAVPIKEDIAKDIKGAQKICEEMLKDDEHVCKHEKPAEQDLSQMDVLQAGIETVCVKEVAKRPSLEGKLSEDEVEQPVIGFEQKVSPAKAEIVMVTPDSAPTSPKFSTDKMYDEELELGRPEAVETPKLPEDVKEVLGKEAPVEEIIEELIITKKKKITIEVIEYITVVKRIPKERVIYIIEEIIVKKGLPRESVVDDPEILKLKEPITPEKRIEVEEYIVNEYIVKGKRITIQVVEEISIKKVVPKKIVIEIIEEIIIKRKIVRHMVFDVPDEVLSEIIQEESPEESPEESAEEQVTPKIDITEKRESIVEITSAAVEVEEPIMPQKRVEVEEFVVNEYVVKGKKMNKSTIDEISAKQTVPKRILIEIIEEIIVKKKIPRNTVLEITEEEISAIIGETPEDQEQEEEPQAEISDEKRKSITEVPISEAKEPVTSQKRAEVEDYIINEYISKGDSITVQKLEEICGKKKVPKRIIIEIIEEIIIKRKMPRHSVLNVTEEEVSRIIEEKERSPEPDVPVEKRKSIVEVSSLDKETKSPVEMKEDKEEDMPEHEVGKEELSEEDGEEEKLVDGFVSVPRRISDDKIDVKKKEASPVKDEMSPLAAKEHEKDVIDDFEAVEQEYKVHDLSVTSPEKADEMREKEDAEEAAEDTTSEVIEADEKFVQETKGKVEKEEPHIDLTESVKSDDEKREPEEPEISEVSEVVDTIEKYLDESKEKTDDILPKEPTTKSVSPVSDKTEKPPIEKVEEPKEVKEKETPQDVVSDKRPSISTTIVPEVISKPTAPSPKAVDDKPITDEMKRTDQKIDESRIPTKDVKSKPATPTKEEVSKTIEHPEEETKLADATGFAKEPKVELLEDDKKLKLLETTEIKDEKSPQEELEEASRRKRSVSQESDGEAPKIKVEDVKLPEKVKDETEKSPEDKPIKTEEDTGTVKRMLVTASSEDGREETEICPTGTITFTKTVTPDDSLKDASVKSTPDKDSLLMDKDSLHSGVSTPEKDSISEKSVTDVKDKVTPEDSLEKSPVGTRDSQDLEDSLEKSEPHKPKYAKPKSPVKDTSEIEKAKSPIEPATEQVDEPKSPAEEVKDQTEKPKSPAEEVGEKMDKPKSPSPLEEAIGKIDEAKPIVEAVTEELKQHEDVQKLKSPLEKSPVEETMEKPTLPIEKILPEPVKEGATIPKTPESLRSEDVSPAETIFSKSPDKHEAHFAKTPISEEDIATEEIAEKLTEPTKESKQIADKDVSLAKEKSPTPESKDDKLLDAVPKEKSRSPSVSSEKPDEKDTSSTSSEKSEDKESVRSKSPQADLLAQPEDKSPSVASVKTEELTEVTELEDKVAEKFPSLSEATEKMPEEIVEDKRPSLVEKEIVSLPDKARSPSISEKKTDDDEKIGDGKLKSPVETDEKVKEVKTEVEKQPEEKEPAGRSKSPSITSEKFDDKSVSDKPSSVLSDGKTEEKETDKPKSPSAIKRETIREKSPIFESEHYDEKGPIDEAKSPSAISDQSDEKKEADRSKSPSIAVDKQQDFEDATEQDYLEKTKSPIFDRPESPKAIDKTEEPDKDRSPSVASDKSDSKKVSDRSRSPSIRQSIDKVDLKDMDLPIEKSPSVASVKDDKVDLKSPRLDEEKADLKDSIQPSLDKSRSPSVTSTISESKEPLFKDESPIVDDKAEEFSKKSKSPSPVEQKLDIGEQEPREKSRSPTIEEQHSAEEVRKSPSPVGEKPEGLAQEAMEKSRSPSVSSDKKEDRSKSPSVAGEKVDIKDIAEQPLDKSRSPSVVSVSADQKEPGDRSKSPSTVGEKPDMKDVVESTVEKSRSPSIISVTGEQKEPTDLSKSPSVAEEKPDLKDVAELLEKSRSPSIVSVSGDQKEPAKSPSVAKPGEKDIETLTDKSRSPSVISATSEQKEPMDLSKPPSLIDEKSDEKDTTGTLPEKSKSPSPVSFTADQKSVEHSKSPSIAGDKLDMKDVLEPSLDKSRSPSVVSITEELKEPLGRSKSPSLAGEKPDVKDVVDTKVDKSRSPSVISVTSEQKEPFDRSKSPSIAGEKPDVKDITDAEMDKSRSPSVISVTSEQKEPLDRSKSPSIAGERPDVKDVTDAEMDKSRSPSVISDTSEQKEPLDRSKSPIIAGEKPDVKDVTDTKVDKSRSPSVISVTSEQKEPLDRSKSPSIAGEKPDLKDVSSEQQIEKSPSTLSVTGDQEKLTEEQKTPDTDTKHESIDRSKSPSVASEKSDDKKSVGDSKSSSIAGDKAELADVTEQPLDKSKSPSVASITSDQKEPLEKAKSPVSTDKKDEPDRSMSPSVASEKSEGAKSAVTSKPSSVAGDMGDLKDVLEPALDKSKSPSVISVTSEQKEPIDKPLSPTTLHKAEEPHDRSKSPSTASEKSESAKSAVTDKKDESDRSKSPSVASEKSEGAKSAVTSKPSSVAGDIDDLKGLLEPALDKSKSPSVASVTSDQKEPSEKAKSPVTDKKDELDRSKSPSVASEKSEGAKSAITSKPSSVVGDIGDLKDVLEPALDKSKSPSVTSMTSEQKEPVSPTTLHKTEEPHDRSKSPSVASEKSDGKKSAEGSKATSVTEEKPDLKDVTEPPADKSRSPSVASLTADKAEIIEKPVSLTVSEKLEPPVDLSKSPSTASDKSDEKTSDDKLGSREHYEDAIDKSPSLIDVKISEKKDAEEKSATIPGKLDVKLADDTPQVHDKPRSPSIILDKPLITDEVDKIDIDELSKSDITSELGLVDKTRSLSIISDRTEPKSPSDVSKSPSLADEKPDQKDKSRSSSIASDDPDTKVAEAKVSSRELPISPSLEVGQVSKDESAKSSGASSPVDKTPKDRSRSQSVFDIGEKTPASRSRTASLFEDKQAEKIPLPKQDASKLASTEKPSDEKDEHKSSPKAKSPITSPEAIQEELKKIREKRFTDFEEPESVEPMKIEKPDEEEEIVIRVTAEKKAEIEKYILEEFIIRKRKISLVVIEKLVMTYSVPQFIVMEIIEDIISQQKMSRSSVFDFVDEEEPVQPQRRTEIENYITEEFIAKKKKVTAEVVEEISLLKIVPIKIIIEIIEEMIIRRQISRDTVIEGDLNSLNIPVKDESLDGKGSLFDSDHYDRDAKVSSASPSLSPEPIPSDKSTQDSPARSEPHIDEEISISEEKRMETEKLLEEEYIKKGKKITEVTLEEIIIKTSLPRYIILEIVEEIILKRKYPRESVIDSEIYQEDEPEVNYEKGMYHYDRPTDTDYELPDDGTRKPPEKYGMDMYTDSDEQQLDKSGYLMGYESQFHKAFVGGMTEMRTTHITTLSGKSTPEYATHDATPESGIEPGDKASGKRPRMASMPKDEEDGKSEQAMRALSLSSHASLSVESSEEDVKVTKTEKQEISGKEPEETKITKDVPFERIGEIQKIVKGEVIQGETETITKLSGREIIEHDKSKSIDDDTILVKKIIKREIIEGEEKPATGSKGATKETDASSDAETDGDVIVVKKIIKREVVEEQEPEEVTKVTTKETDASSDAETDGDVIVVKKIIKREVVEEQEPEEVTKVTTKETDASSDAETDGDVIVVKKIIKREVVEEQEPEEVTKVTTKETDASSDAETDGDVIVVKKIIKREVVEEQEPEEVTKVTTKETDASSDAETDGDVIVVKKIIKREVVEEQEPEEVTKVTTKETDASVDAETDGDVIIVKKIIKREVVEEQEPEEVTKVTTKETDASSDAETDGDVIIVKKIIKREVVEEQEPEEVTKVTTKETDASSDAETDGDVTIVKKIIKREVVEEQEPEEVTKVMTHTVDTPESSDAADHDGDVIVVKKIVKREVIDQEEPEVAVIKEIKRPSMGQDEPEAITKIIKREIVEHGEPEVVTKVVKREIIEQDEPEVITKVIKREVIVPDEETSDFQEDSGEFVKTITTKTTRTIVTQELSDTELSQVDPSKIYTDSASGTSYKVVSDESTADAATSSADVKRIVTTVTTITGPDGKVTTKKDVKESSDTVDSEELLEKLIDSTSGDKASKLATEAKSAEKIVKETIATVTSGTSTPDVKAFYDSGKSTPDSKQEDKPEGTVGKETRLGAEKLEHSVSPLVKDLISDDKSYSGKSSPDISLPKDIIFSGSTGKSTPEIPMSPLIRDGAAVQPHLSGRSTPDRRSEGRSSTATPEGFKSGEMIRTIITTTKTISDEGEIVTTTREVTETTNEKGETVVLAEKTDVKVDERLPSKDAAESAISSIIGSIKSTELQHSDSPGSDETSSEKDRGPISPPSDSSVRSKAMTHVWGSSEERHTYSDDEPPSSSLSSTSQVGYSPQTTHRHDPVSDKEEEQKTVEFSAAAMSSSFYGELPAVPPQISAMKTFHGETGMQRSETGPVRSRFMVEKEFAGGYAEKPEAKRYVDEADLDFDKALMEHKEMKETGSAFGSGIAPRYTNGSLRHETEDAREHPSSSFQDDAKDDSKGDSKKDPLTGWGSPLGLPSPKPPRKFNLKNPSQPSCSNASTSGTLNFDVVKDWGEPLRLPSPAPVTNEVLNKGTPGTPKKERKQAKKVQSENMKNKKRSESPGKNEKKMKDSKNKIQPVYMDLAYVPHHGNSYYSSLEFFKRVRARYYVFSGTEPSREVYDALLEAKKTWEDKDLEVTMIPTYDTDTLGYWVADNEEALAANHIDLSPSASRCTINLQDHETSCSAYRLEF
ncbi:microtubule-associated protein futsch isoform X2 [Odontomachus brunneus]|uniref:microtubule-associated protein futsch isoform X2 n=1 Tax=Odontomachus brunneus TaxID=486640 RepID=UPI0013F2461F|nr:microtubule-associated protein futsch isoform X2 [Odontomachus brunneus]